MVIICVISTALTTVKHKWLQSNMPNGNAKNFEAQIDVKQSLVTSLRC